MPKVPLSLPEADQLNQSEHLEPGFCKDRFDMQYIYDLRDHAIQYCSSGSTSTLTCFHSHTQSNNDRDSLCIGQGAVLDPKNRRFTLDCEVRQPNQNESSRGLIPFDSIRGYWYDTGPGFLLNSFMTIEGSSQRDLLPDSHYVTNVGNRRPFTVLVKREGHSNIWHSLMEIWSFTMTLDVLRLSPNVVEPQEPFFTVPEDIPKAQVIFMDDHTEGPLYPLWQLFAGRKPVRFKEVLEDGNQSKAFAETPQNLILPLAGGSNPLWQNDWEERDCKNAPLLKIFVQRIMQHFGIRYERGRKPTKSLQITLIDRKGSRKLLQQDALLRAVRSKFPDINTQLIDLATLPFAEQIRIAQTTDVLVGVHGAGLTHTMFLREGAAVVEIQPEDMFHKGFRNLAKMIGVHYVSTHAEMVGAEEDQKSRKRGLVRRDRWHWADIRIEEDRFLELINTAVELTQQ
ncbi:DUF563 domain-containing protein [Colletotrichum navitas]|uniref:EGF domain-specific O-linked N-acetylglucosamine transferase n=1 Tax=Colletotrichum navitas TaxID=681940 RepID=A0AAD8V0D9_9PEZI|nr:DUF563 domain-containing protein [Colletotrichum navitas]KAK1574677.1 DUF563 domain-containing protein [Colletotrichum navitas]